jgi:hypothetical protein
MCDPCSCDDKKNRSLDALNHVLDLSIPEFREEGGTMIIPGHGRLSDSADVGYYRDIHSKAQNVVYQTTGVSLAEFSKYHL